MSTDKLSAINLREMSLVHDLKKTLESVDTSAVTAVQRDIESQISRMAPALARIQEELESRSFTPEVEQLRKQMLDFEGGISQRMKELSGAALATWEPTQQLARFLETNASEQLRKMVPLESSIGSSRADEIIRNMPVNPLPAQIRTLGDALVESIEGLAERLEKRLESDAASAQAQLIQLSKILETLVTISAAASEASTAAAARNELAAQRNEKTNRRILWLTVVMALSSLAPYIPNLIKLVRHLPWFR